MPPHSASSESLGSLAPILRWGALGGLGIWFGRSYPLRSKWHSFDGPSLLVFASIFSGLFFSNFGLAVRLLLSWMVFCQLSPGVESTQRMVLIPRFEPRFPRTGSFRRDIENIIPVCERWNSDTPRKHIEYYIATGLSSSSIVPSKFMLPLDCSKAQTPGPSKAQHDPDFSFWTLCASHSEQGPRVCKAAWAKFNQL